MNLSPAQKHSLMTKLLQTQAGRQRIASNINQPLRTLQDYQSVLRKLFMIDPIPDGALPIYDCDVDIPVYVVGEEADSVQTVMHAKRLMVPMFELATNPTVPFTQIKERRYDIVSRIKKKVVNEIFRKEDRLIAATLKTAAMANTNNPLISCTESQFGVEVIADAFAEVEKNGLFVDKVIMNPRRAKALRLMGRDILDFTTQREILRTGNLGTMYGASVLMSMEVPEDMVFVCTTPEYLGVLAQKIELSVIPADEPAARRIGWSCFLQEGIGLHNADRGLCGIQISSDDGDENP